MEYLYIVMGAKEFDIDLKGSILYEPYNMAQKSKMK